MISFLKGVGYLVIGMLLYVAICVAVIELAGRFQ